MEACFRRHLVASHPRKHTPSFTIHPADMPRRHREHPQWSPGWLNLWAGYIELVTQTWVGDQLEHWKHPEQAHRVCLGLLNLSKHIPPPLPAQDALPRWHQPCHFRIAGLLCQAGAALIPKSRINLTRIHGVFTPNSNFRKRVTPVKRGRG